MLLFCVTRRAATALTVPLLSLPSLAANEAGGWVTEGVNVEERGWVKVEEQGWVKPSRVNADTCWAFVGEDAQPSVSALHHLLSRWHLLVWNLVNTPCLTLQKNPYIYIYIFSSALFVSQTQWFVKLTLNKTLQLILGLVETCQAHRPPGDWKQILWVSTQKLTRVFNCSFVKEN